MSQLKTMSSRYRNQILGLSTFLFCFNLSVGRIYFPFVVKRMEIIYHIWDTNSERHKSLVSDKKRPGGEGLAREMANITESNKHPTDQPNIQPTSQTFYRPTKHLTDQPNNQLTKQISYGPTKHWTKHPTDWPNITEPNNHPNNQTNPKPTIFQIHS